MFSKEESNLIFSPSPGGMMSQNNLTSHIPEWSGPSLFSRLMLTLLVYLTVFTLFLVLIGVWLVGMWRKEQQRTAAASRPPPSYISMFPQEPPAYHDDIVLKDIDYMETVINIEEINEERSAHHHNAMRTLLRSKQCNTKLLCLYHTSKSSINSLHILCLTFCLVVSLMKII